MMRRGLDRVTSELSSVSLDLLSHLAYVRAGRIAWELRYRIDQARAPQGRPDGGQWIRDVVHVAVLRPRPVAPRCEGPSCQNGGSFGTSGMFNVQGRKLCWDCAIKRLGLQGLPTDEQLKTIRDFDENS
jgi:hypothetical protein